MGTLNLRNEVVIMETELKKQRQRAGLTQQEVIRRLGISRISYHRYENGERIPDAQTASLIARAVGSTVESLWGGNPVRA